MKEKDDYKCIFKNCGTRFKSIKNLKAHVKNQVCVEKCRLAELTKKLETISINSETTAVPSLSSTETHVKPKENLDNLSLSEISRNIFENDFDWIIKKISNMNLNYNQINQCFEIMQGLIQASEKICISRLSQGSEASASAESVIKTTMIYIQGKISEYDTQHKRRERYRSQENFVEPRTIKLGLAEDNTEETYEYVPLLDTLQCLFRDSNFKNAYLKYNSETEHHCVAGIYSRYCCGKNFKRWTLFRTQPQALQLQFYIDDVQLASALKYNTRRYKVCGIYCIVRNVGEEYTTRLTNVHLVAICRTIYLKKYCLNKILDPIITDIQYLEDTGLNVDCYPFLLKGTLINFCYDNLGGNTLLGLCETFNSAFCCRFCLKIDHELRIEDVSLLRTKAKYTEALKKIKKSSVEKLKLKDTYGYTSQTICSLQKLKYYDIFYNRSIDLMHNLNEGVINFVLTDLFKVMLANGVVESKEEIKNLIIHYNYSDIDKHSKPSEISLDKDTLNISATQSYTLFINVPFIFEKYVDKPVIKNFWIIITSLLQILQIVYSAVITEEDIENLTRLISVFLLQYRKHTTAKKFKMHVLIHLPNTIREMGPVKYMTMSRAESKHRELKVLLERAPNFKDTIKTLSENHQIKNFNCESAFVDVSNSSKHNQTLKKFIETNLNSDISEFENTLKRYFGDNCEQVVFKKFLQINSVHYRKGLFMIKEDCYYRVVTILFHQEYFLVVELYKKIGINTITNSVEVEKVHNAQLEIIKVNTFKNKNTYSAQKFKNVMNIIKRDLNVQ